MQTRHPNYRGGSITEHRYVLTYVGKDHHLADVRGYTYEHRLVAERALGRRLQPGEEVHHLDEDTLNNSPDNLLVGTRAEHKAFHRKRGSKRRLPGEDNPLVACVCGCGETLHRFDDYGRPRRFLPFHFKRGQHG